MHPWLDNFDQTASLQIRRTVAAQAGYRKQFFLAGVRQNNRAVLYLNALPASSAAVRSPDTYVPRNVAAANGHRR